MKVCFDVSPTGITTRGLRRRCIETHDIRRIHLFMDANGDQGLVIRKSLVRFVHLPALSLQHPALLDQVRTLVEQVRSTATIDAAVDEFLAETTRSTDAALADAA
jgi:hypothetical protein